jgi:hypothetical protein
MIFEFFTSKSNNARIARGVFILLAVAYFWWSSNDAEQKKLAEARVVLLEQEINQVFADYQQNLKFFSAHSKFYAGLEPRLRRINALAFQKTQFRVTKCELENKKPICQLQVFRPALTQMSLNNTLLAVQAVRNKDQASAKVLLDSSEQAMIARLKYNDFLVDDRWYFSVSAIVEDDLKWTVDAKEMVKELERLIYYR